MSYLTDVKLSAAHTTHLDALGVGNGAGVLIVASARGESEVGRTVDVGRRCRTVLTVGGGGLEGSVAGFTTASQAVAVPRLARMYPSRDGGVSWHRTRF